MMVWHQTVGTDIHQSFFPLYRSNQIYQGPTLVDIADLDCFAAVACIEEHQESLIVFRVLENDTLVNAPIKAVVPFVGRERSGVMTHRRIIADISTKVGPW